MNSNLSTTLTIARLTFREAARRKILLAALVLGVPARVIRRVDDQLTERIRRTWEHYVAEARRHRSGAVPRHPPSRMDGL